MSTRLLAVFFTLATAHAAEETVYQWRDQDGVTHFSDAQENAQGIKEAYAAASDERVIAAPTSREKTTRKSVKHNATTHSGTRASDDDKRPVLSAECEWLRGRIANLRRLTHGNRDSAFYDEQQRRQAEWKKEQCQRGTHVWNRDLLPVRKARAKTP